MSNLNDSRIAVTGKRMAWAMPMCHAMWCKWCRMSESRTANLRLETAPPVEAVPAWSKSAPENPGANRAADGQPLCGFAPGLLPHIRHCVGFEVGPGVGGKTKLGKG